MSKLLLFITMTTLPVFAFFDRSDDPARRAERLRETQGAAYDYYRQRLDSILEETHRSEESVMKFYLTPSGATVIFKDGVCELTRFGKSCRSFTGDQP